MLETAGKSTFARKHLDAHRAATMTVRVTPNARGRRAIAQNRRAHRATFINISVTYTPNGGTASTQTSFMCDSSRSERVNDDLATPRPRSRR